VETTALFEEIGRLKVELDWLKKKAPLGNLWVRIQGTDATCGR